MRQRAVVVVSVLVLALLGAGSYFVLRPAPSAPGAVVAPPQPVSATPVAPVPASPPAPAPAAKTGAKSRPASPLPPLVAGNPFTDDEFAQVSAQIVIASYGLKRDAKWQMLVLAYMDQALKKHGYTAEQYKEYAEALYRNPDRGRAVGENIMLRVEKKLGVRVDMKALPFLKYDQETIRKLEKKLRE